MARKILIATHGRMAAGIRDSLSVFLEDTRHIAVINCFTETKDPSPVLEAYFADLEEEDELIVMTDLMAGSVNQMLMAHLEKRPFHLLTGVNLPLAMQVALCMDEQVTKEFLRESILQAQGEIRYVNDEIDRFANQEHEDDLFD